jgi:hypothetical protein
VSFFIQSSIELAALKGAVNLCFSLEMKFINLLILLGVLILIAFLIYFFIFISIFEKRKDE